jgi:hypothetical protein
MASLKEAFADQSDFYNDQQLKYTDIEPNRFQPNAVSGMTNTIISGVYDQLGHYDPYTGETRKPITKAGIGKLLQGQPDKTPEELACRTYIGLSGLIRLMGEVDSSSPVRCGWRYTKASPGQSKGALGTRNGPLNANEDVLNKDTAWFWDLNDALKTYLRDIAMTLTSANAMAAYNAAYPLPLPQFKWCESTQKVYPVNSDGYAKYPRDKNFSCPPLTGNATNTIIAGQAAGLAAKQLSAAAAAKASCSNPGANTFLSRDCFLQAVKDNGCSDKGTLYRSLQSENPSGSRWDTYLKTTRAFIDYQSKQGANGITDALFQRNKSVWSDATAPITKLQNAAENATDPQVKAAAKDLCNTSGSYDTYDFCKDIGPGTSIGAVDLICIQRYWQENNGKPAGTAYPRSRTFDALLGTPSTWKLYKTAVDTLKKSTKSTDPVVQRKAIDAFYGVRIGTTSFTPTTINSNTFELTSPPCYGYGSPGTGALAGMRSYTKSECDSMNGISYSDGQCLAKGGGSYTYDCRNLNAIDAANTLVLWLDAKDGSTLTIDGTGSVKTWKDKSGKGNNVTQKANGPIYKGGASPYLQFNGTSSVLDLTNDPSSLVKNSSVTIFVVEQRTSNKSLNMFLGGSNRLITGYMKDTQIIAAGWSADLRGTIEPYKASDPYRIWCLHFSPTGRTIFINGKVVPGDAPNPTATDKVNDVIPDWVNGAIGRFNDKYYYQGNIKEVMIFKTALDSNEKRQKIEGYLAWKWGLQANLDNNHPYKNVAP